MSASLKPSAIAEILLTFEQGQAHFALEPDSTGDVEVSPEGNITVQLAVAEAQFLRFILDSESMTFLGFAAAKKGAPACPLPRRNGKIPGTPFSVYTTPRVLTVEDKRDGPSSLGGFHYILVFEFGKAVRRLDPEILNEGKTPDASARGDSRLVCGRISTGPEARIGA